MLAPDHPGEYIKIVKESYCQHCGLCFPFCKRVSENKDASECKNCLLCYNVCPRLKPPGKFKQPEEPTLGQYIKILRVKSVTKPPNSQNSGVVTLLVKYLLESGWVEAALLTGRKKNWVPEPFWAKSDGEAERASGSKYSTSPSLLRFKEGLIRFERLAIVGLPCQIAALNHLQNFKKGFSIAGRSVFTIGLFCMNSFIHAGLKNVIESEMQLSMEKIKKIEISRGLVQVYQSDSKKTEARSIKLFNDAIWPICLACTDFTALAADISIGSIGTKDDENTVIIRSDRANQLMDHLIKKGLIEARDLKDLTQLIKLIQINIRRRNKLSDDQKSFLGKKTVLGNWVNRMNRNS